MLDGHRNNSFREFLNCNVIEGDVVAEVMT